MNSANINHYFYMMYYFFLWTIKPINTIRKKAARKTRAAQVFTMFSVFSRAV